MDCGQPFVERKGQHVHRLLIFLLSVFFGAVLSLPAGAQVYPDHTFIAKDLKSKKQAVVLSAVFPGLGQIGLGARAKGMSIFVAQLTTLLVAINANENYKTVKGRHAQETEQYLALRQGGRFEQAQQRWNVVQDMEDDLDRYHRWRQVGYLAAGIYVYNMIDILFFTQPSTDEQTSTPVPNRLQLSARIIDRSPGIRFTYYGL